jgi:hypothetical protein
LKAILKLANLQIHFLSEVKVIYSPVRFDQVRIANKILSLKATNATKPGYLTQE